MSPRPQLPADEVEARRFAICEATLDEIVARGPEAVRMRDVASAAGVSVGAVQYYFASRDDLLVAAFSLHSVEVIAAIGHLSREASPWVQLQASFEAVPSVGGYARRSALWIELVAAARRNAVLASCVDEVFDSWRAHFSSIIDTGIREGEFDPLLPAESIVDVIIAQIDGFDLAVASGRRRLTPAQISAGLEATASALLRHT
ncbi:TetR/AcrR family transcriptional regulator [Brevibacterium aurantiacum]|uniref:TetR/AcrR family transcriptional regulator n=1 Tax=Brevibacterium aurantiacum TaxID=273384 RepID=A0A2A3ZSZ7_BREAU|nr:TetR family transcriptional regulator [Brevibacterium aurantiacum]PCC54674.1 TetR/AcrR family transcriptional regulator [Brevibacterium aurantiacum]RCS91958.1 TetR/AcrR family transcriptional regulator [Brevibacterium aurantiacum]